MQKSKLGKNLVFNLTLFGLVGQIAWAVENIYFNTFLFNYIGGTTKDISRMVALSAVTAVVTTFFMGTLSDKLNRRKSFIAGGYIFWGLTVMVFALISRENIAKLFNLSQDAKIVAATVSVVILMDCLMTFMGSTSNDAAFNAWITDVTVPENRGKTEGLLSVFPILGTVLVMVGFGALEGSLGYPACFLGLGALMALCGLTGLFSVKDSRAGMTQSVNYWEGLVQGFRPATIKENAPLYWTFVASGITGISLQVFFPYIFIYLQHYIGLDLNNVAEGLEIKPGTIVIAVAALALIIGGAVGIGALMDRLGKQAFIFPCAALMILALAAAFFARNLLSFGLLALLVIAGNSVLGMIIGATMRDFTPEDKAGQFQGVRMIFFVLLPMVIGPYIGNGVIERFAARHDMGTYLNEFDELVNVPVPEIFLAAAAVGLLLFIPLVFVRKYVKQRAGR